MNLGFLGKKINLTKIKKNNLDHRSDFKIEQLKLWSNAIDQFKILIKRKKSSIFSLRFCLSFYPVISAIPGMMNKKEISENASILKMKKVSFNNTVLLKCRDIYLKNNFIYNSLLKRN